MKLSLFRITFNWFHLTKIFLFISIGFLFNPIEMYAWGPVGHHIAGQIAKSQLTAATLDSVQKYLGAMSFEDASTWMDDMRSDPSYDYMKTWHYVNIEKGQKYSPKPGERNVVTEIERVINELNSKSSLTKEKISTDIKVLFHLVEDLGMPLHAGYPDDKGGNTVQVNFEGRKVNLHHVWDTDIIVFKNITTEQCLALGKNIPKQKVTELTKTDILSWVSNAQSLLPAVYDFTNYTIDENYIEKNTPVIEKQLYISGLRLANVLNHIFSK